jgi:hypothetical protein
MRTKRQKRADTHSVVEHLMKKTWEGIKKREDWSGSLAGVKMMVLCGLT